MIKRVLLKGFLLLSCLQVFVLNTAAAAPKNNYQLYASFLEQNEFLYKLKKKQDNGDRKYGLTFYDTYGNQRYRKKSVSFCLADLNGDDTKELIVARMHENWTPQSMDLYVFTIRSGKVVFVKYQGTNDYSFRSSGLKLLYSNRYGALYCPSLIQNSDAYYDDETTCYAVYRMSGKQMKRIRYAQVRVVDKLGKKKRLRKQTYKIQRAGSSKEETSSGEEFGQYLEDNFEELDLSVIRMYENSEKNRKKYLLTARP